MDGSILEAQVAVLFLGFHNRFGLALRCFSVWVSSFSGMSGLFVQMRTVLDYNIPYSSAGYIMDTQDAFWT